MVFNNRHSPTALIVVMTVLLGVNCLLSIAAVSSSNKRERHEVEEEKVVPPLKPADLKNTPFCWKLWNASVPTVAKIDGHPFLQGLINGKLPLTSFQFYIRQDSLYLQEYARGLALLAIRAPPEYNATLQLLQFAMSSLVVESGNHERWMTEWGDQEVLKYGKSRNNVAYTSFLLDTAANRPWEEGLAAFTPCFWIYLHVGKNLLEQRRSQGPSPVKYFDEWIMEYSGDGFSDSVNKMLAIVEKAAQNASPVIQQRMVDAYVTASKMEWMFWNSAYDVKSGHSEFWPI